MENSGAVSGLTDKKDSDFSDWREYNRCASCASFLSFKPDATPLVVPGLTV